MHANNLPESTEKQPRWPTLHLEHPQRTMMPPPYVRPTNDAPLSPAEKKELLQAYFSHYESVAQQDPQLLNMKLERAAVSGLLDQMGVLLLEQSQQLAHAPGPMREFLDATEPPDCLRGRLPPEFRAFCLALNALKQWVSAESAATDRFLIGGTARAQCRRVADRCLVTGDRLDETVVELHHTVRDGRPPIPLSKSGHERIESNTETSTDPRSIALRDLKRQGNRSWVMLRRGCLAIEGDEFTESTPAVLVSSKTFARKASETTGLSYRELLSWLDERELGN
ncbi:hypothetical protein [Allorhodopirellula solitaria]|nr:hypothetical protein [Allorhodopirellula solitaria]